MLEVEFDYFLERNKIRTRFNSYLSHNMLGAEIGAGPFPHPLPADVYCEYFDKRSPDELAQYFHGHSQSDAPKVRKINELAKCTAHYDFLISHHTLEHVPNPVGQLIEWHRAVKEGGLICLSLPYYTRTHDRDRQIPSFDHLALDYLLQRDGNEFDSKEHIPAFIMSWRNDGFFGPLDKEQLAQCSLNAVQSTENDLHWHCFDSNTVRAVVEMAGYFGRRTVQILDLLSPDDYDPSGRLNDCIILYRIGSIGLPNDSCISEQLSDLQTKLHTALAAFS